MNTTMTTPTTIPTQELDSPAGWSPPKSEPSVELHGVVEAATLPQPIRGSDRKALIEGLSRVLADTYAVYLKTQGYHWNVQGPQFHQLHAMFEEQYTELAAAVDVIAERIRALGGFAPAGFERLSALTEIPEERGAPGAPEMLQRLEHDHRTVCTSLRLVMERAGEMSDPATEDLMIERLRAHEHFAWMIRASAVA